MKEFSMDSDRLPRKLAAILYADVAGYSRLTGEDEDATHRCLSTYLDIVAANVSAHRGRVMHYAGDAALAQFSAVLDAISCAISVQKELKDRNQDLPCERKVEFRIGINLGDVIEDRGDIYGDGVNIAARLESLAEPGGVCISGTARDAIGNKIPAEYRFMGEQQVKNIANSIRAYQVVLDVSDDSSPKQVHQPGTGDTPPKLPDKPSVAVLPFDNISGDPEQEYFADGITEDIITDLSRYPNLFVIARNSSFTYKGQPVRLQAVGEELGVHYVVEGSIRKAGNRVRVTVQLIEAATEKHVWAERYDRELTDIFEIQDELTQAIVGALPARLEAADIERIKRKPPQHMAAYDYVLRSKVLHHIGTKQANSEALESCNKAIEIDPDFAQAYAWKACTLRQSVIREYTDEPELAGAQRVENAEKALALDENDMECLRILCEINMEQRALDQAEKFHNRAFEMNPNDPRMLAQRGELMTWMGRHAEGAEWVQKAMRLDPLGAKSFAHLLGRALLAQHQYEEALQAYRQITAPRYSHHADMAVCHARLGNKDEAGSEASAAIRLKENFSIKGYLANLPYREDADLEHHRQGLHLAGLPD
jgi:adenylate cyclase